MSWGGIKRTSADIWFSKAIMQDVYEQVNRALGEKFGVSIPWPDEYTMELDRKLKAGGMRYEY